MGHAFELRSAESSVVVENVFGEVGIGVAEGHIGVADVVAGDEPVERLV